MVFEAAVDLNVLSYSVPIIMRGRGEVDSQGETSLWTSGEAKSALGGRREAESIPKPSSEAELALIPWVRPSPALGGRARQSLALSPRARRSWPKDVGRGGV